MSRYYTLLCSLIFTIVSSYSCKTEADKLSYNPPVFPLEHHAEITKLNDDWYERVCQDLEGKNV